MEQTRLILVVEDDPAMRELLRLRLAEAGYRVLEAESAEVGLHLFRTRKPDLILLDKQLPDADGSEVCRKVRGHPELAATPVVMLTAEGKLDSKTEGFSAGADQYLVKPVRIEELLLWLQAIFRRQAYGKEEPDLIAAGELSIDVRAHLARFGDRVISDLTAKEFDLFCLLVRRRPQVLSREQILKSLWDTVTVDRVVDAHMSNLRKKLPPQLADRIQNIPGKGYRYFG